MENASGKTTLIKGLCINILLCQQIGYGYFKSGSLNPYSYINSYLNVVDNNDSDSLFQSEARKCKEILDNLKSNKKRHFCIFDELYSGTNPEDANLAASKYLKYISKLNCDFVITTHYKDLCLNFTENEDFINKHMINYKYTTGISKKTNGLKIGRIKLSKELLK